MSLLNKKLNFHPFTKIRGGNPGQPARKAYNKKKKKNFKNPLGTSPYERMAKMKFIFYYAGVKLLQPFKQNNRKKTLTLVIF